MEYEKKWKKRRGAGFMQGNERRRMVIEERERE